MRHFLTRHLPALLIVAAIGLFMPALTSCERGAAEEAGEAVDDALDDTGDAVRDAGDAVDDAVDDAADAIEDATN